MKNTLIKLVVIAAVMIPCAAAAQTSSINAFSPYTMYGIGEQNTPGTLPMRSMGGVGVAMRSSGVVNLLNPAAFSAAPQKSFLFNFGLEGQNYYNSQKVDGMSKSTAYNTFNFHDIAFQLPLAKKLGLGFSLTPYSSVGYRTKYTHDYDPSDPVWGNVGRAQYIYQGEGDVTEVKLGVGWELFKNFSLGIGIISYKGAPPTEAEYDAVYRIDTDVITSTTLSTTGEINNDAKATVTFSIGGRSYQMSGVVIPENGSQLVWVKWHTPSEPCEITINISTNKGRLATTTIRANVVDLNENPPPDPMADDRYNGYSRPSLPAGQNVASLSWGIWRCWWHANWVWVSDWDWESGSHSSSCPAGCTSSHGHWVDNGEWEDQGWYDYALDTYSASLSTAMRITPDEKNPTASGSTLKSGYGINMTATADMRSGAPASHITQVQTCVAYFPEFHYTDYWRLLKPTSPGYSAQFEFQRNEYSTYNRRTHFTPVWFPDGNYTVYAQVIDAWTPAGMLQMHLNDTLTIHDNLFSDWHVRPLN